MLDAIISDLGTVALLTPLTPAAREWADENLQIEPWQRFADSIACEPRYLPEVVARMRAEGLIVEPE